jgi:hypothetical protein
LAVTASNLVLGPARLYAAAVGSTEPLDSAVTPNGTTTPPSSPWVDVGGTDGGVQLNVAGTYQDLVVDQTIVPVGARLTDLAMDVTVKLSEMTLNNLNLALNSITAQGSGSGYATSDITVTSVASQPTYAALIIDGWAPALSSGAAALRRVICRKTLSQPKVDFMFDRKTQQGIACVFKIFVVSSSVNPIHIIDQTS